MIWQGLGGEPRLETIPWAWTLCPIHLKNFPSYIKYFGHLVKLFFFQEKVVISICSEANESLHKKDLSS
jgi:hypothetical protein